MHTNNTNTTGLTPEQQKATEALSKFVFGMIPYPELSATLNQILSEVMQTDLCDDQTTRTNINYTVQLIDQYFYALSINTDPSTLHGPIQSYKMAV